MPTRVRHCRCRQHLAPNIDLILADIAQRLDAASLPPLTLAQVRGLRAYLEGDPERPDRRRDLALKRISSPDAHGHMHWTGPRPLRGGPQVQFDGHRVSPAVWLWLRAGGIDAPLVRTCHDPQCIAPAHHALESAPEQRRAKVMSARLMEFDALNPPIKYRPKRWDRTDPKQARCFGGHALSVYGDPRLRTAYCPSCAALERARLSKRRDIEAEVNRLWGHTQDPPRNPLADSPVQDIPDGPTLVDMLLAEQESQPSA